MAIIDLYIYQKLIIDKFFLLNFLLGVTFTINRLSKKTLLYVGKNADIKIYRNDLIGSLSIQNAAIPRIGISALFVKYQVDC